jgi:D-3-phosphoglycerate dehydrogenase
MAATSLAKSNIGIVLLEGVHPSAAEMLQRAGYTNIVSHAKSLAGDSLTEALKGAYFAGIRSATQLTADVLERAP